MNLIIPCQFSAPTKFRCAIHFRAPLQASGISPRWKPVLRRRWPVMEQADRRNAVWIELNSPQPKQTKTA